MVSFVERMPKVELHLHLEGAVPLDTLWTLIEKYGGDPRAPSPAALSELFRYRDFGPFLELWTWKNRFLRESDDFTLVGAAVARALARQNILYAEAFYSPGEFAPAGLDVGRITEALRRGLDRVAGARVALVADVVRDLGPERALATVDAVAELRGLGVIGIGLGGSEHRFPPELFAAAFARARSLGLHVTAHAGEAAGPESVWGALRVLGAERIGHGIRAAEDPALVEHLARTGVALEICPVSNLRTGVVARIEEHPIRTFVDAGVRVTLGSDDPTLFGTTLAGEYQLLVDRLGFTRAEILRLVQAGVDASWLDSAPAAALRARIEADSLSTR